MASKRKRCAAAENRAKSELQRCIVMCRMLEAPKPANLVFLLDCCLVAWDKKQEAPLQVLREKLLDTLVSFCEKLKRFFKNPLWRAYNLTLTGMVGTIRGSFSDEVKLLRSLNKRMDFVELARYSQTLVFNADFLPFIRTGLALQGFVDVLSSDSCCVSNLGTADLIHLAEGLVEGFDKGVFEQVRFDAWLSFLGEIFIKGVQLDDWKIVAPTLKLILRYTPEKFSVSPKTFLVFLAIYSSLTFPAMLKATRELFASALDVQRIDGVFMNVCSRICEACLEPVDLAEESLHEMKLLRHDLYLAGRKLSFDSVLTTASVANLKTVDAGVRLYCWIVHMMARNITPRFLDKQEKNTAVQWLSGLQEQAANAFVDDESDDLTMIRLERGRAAATIEMALLITDDPEYLGKNFYKYLK